MTPQIPGNQVHAQTGTLGAACPLHNPAMVLGYHQQYIVVDVELVNFLSQCDNSNTNDASLQHITNHKVSCHSAHLVPF